MRPAPAEAADRRPVATPPRRGLFIPMSALTHTAVVAVASVAAVLANVSPEIGSALTAAGGVAAVAYTALWGGRQREGNCCGRCGHHG
ncbi:hypothetical protein ACQEU3_16950 [Spirillospora sp. CA-253888]